MDCVTMRPSRTMVGVHFIVPGRVRGCTCPTTRRGILTDRSAGRVCPVAQVARSSSLKYALALIVETICVFPFGQCREYFHLMSRLTVG